MFQFRRFPSYTYLIQYMMYVHTHTDCSIRKSADQFILADPRSLSQLITSFIGSQCQGIHSMLFLTWPFKSSTLALKSFLFTMLILSVNSGFSQQIDFWNRYPYSCLLPGDRLVLDSLSICLLLVFDIIQFSKYSFTQSFSRWLCHCSFRPQSHTSVCSFVLIRVPRHQEKSCVNISRLS